MNIELLNKVKAAILPEPEHFDMEMWYSQNQCGTAACIGGWTVALARNLSLERADERHANTKTLYCQDEANKLLGLTEDRGTALFWERDWPQPFRGDFGEASAAGNRPAMAQIAADRIGHFVKTEGRE